MTVLQGNRQVDRIVARIGDLPAMPAVVSQVLRLTDDPDTPMEDIARVLQADPALTAKILRVSNSPYYGMKQYVSTLKLALVILGVREVRNIVLGISVFDTFRKEGVAPKIAHAIWVNSLRVAGLCRELSQRLGISMQGEEFVTGLLHDIGKMVLLMQFEAKYSVLYNKHCRMPMDLYEAEMETFAFSNADAAMALAQRWNLPENLTEALWYQYPNIDRPLSQLKKPELAAVLRLAKFAMHDDFRPETADADLVSLNMVEAWETLEFARNVIPPSERRKVLTDLVSEAMRGPEIMLD